jgi:hypothetical protein
MRLGRELPCMENWSRGDKTQVPVLLDQTGVSEVGAG